MSTKFLDLCSKYRNCILVAALIVMCWNLMAASIELDRIEVNMDSTLRHMDAINKKLDANDIADKVETKLNLK